MKVLHVSFSDNTGGAAKAALRICIAQRNQGIAAEMLVFEKKTDLYFVKGWGSAFKGVTNTLKSAVTNKILSFQQSENPIMHSLNLFSRKAIIKYINAHDADIVNLHWINNDLLSIADLAKIKKKIVWTLHDTWAYCGAEHYPDGLEDDRFMKGYTKENNRNRGMDIDRWTWKRKLRHWNQIPLNIVSPSTWQYECASASFLFRQQVHLRAGYALDLEAFRPYEKAMARKVFQLNPDKKYILFGADGGTIARIKGFDLLKEALLKLKNQLDPNQYELLIFGASEAPGREDFGFKTTFMGRLYDETTMGLLYAAADCMVVPSRLDNLPQTAGEAIACGTPVVAFNIGGLPDIIVHKEYGYLARPYDTTDLGAGIRWVLEEADAAQLATNARKAACERYAEANCAAGYKQVYQQVLNEVR